MQTKKQIHFSHGTYNLKDLIDFDQLEKIFRHFTDVTGFNVALVTYPEQEYLFATGGREICTLFHRKCPSSACHCKASNLRVTSLLKQEGDVVLNRCDNGLIDGATPVIIHGTHVASIFSGQILTEEPDREFFRGQALLHGYDVDAYMKALGDVPVVPEERLRKIITFLGEISTLIVNQILSKAELRSQKEMFRTVVDYTHGWEYWTDPDEGLRYISPSCERITGYSVAEFTSNPALLESIICPADRQIYICHTDHCRADTDVVHNALDYRIITKGGEVRWISHSCRPVYAEDGSPLGRRVSNKDITERKIAEQALQEERNLFSEGPVCTIVWDPSPTWPVRYVSSNVTALLGITPEEMQASGFLYKNLIHPDDFERIAAEVAGYTASGTDTFEQSYRMKRKDGEYRWFYDFTKMVRNSEGEVTEIRGYFFDQTHLVEAQTELSRSEEKLRYLNQHLEALAESRSLQLMEKSNEYQFLLDNLPIQVYYKDLNNTVLRVNRPVLEFFRLTHEQIEGKKGSGLFGSLSEEMYREDMKAATRNRISTMQHAAERDGKVHVYEATRIPVVREGVVIGLVMLMRDVTEMEEMRQERERQEDLLIQQSKLAEMGNMIAIIAHQWKQPLNVISIAMSIYKEDNAGNEDAEMLVVTVDEQIRFMVQTINDFRNFFVATKEKRVFLIRDVVDQVVRLLMPVLKTEGISIAVHAGKPQQVYGFRNELMQVVMNLVNNARDVIIERKVKPGHIDIEISSIADIVVMKVRDNGGGIPAALLPDRLFEKYVSTKGEKGTGIGLSMSKMIIEKYMDGTLHAYNVDGGAEFIVTLPARAETPQSQEGMRNATILFVEDDDIARNMTLVQLEKRYTRVLTASDGAEGLELFMRYRKDIQLVLTDIDMPRMNGVAMSRQIREEYPAIPVVVLTALKDDAYTDIGFNAVLEKPVAPERLIATIDRLL